jgi:hypothetical protein
MNTIQTLLPGLHPEQLAAIKAQVLAYYRQNLIREIERLSPTALTQVSAVVSGINELDFLLQVETDTTQPLESQHEQAVAAQQVSVPLEQVVIPVEQVVPTEQVAENHSSQQTQVFDLPFLPLLSCQGCIEGIENQLAHLEMGGCLVYP